MALICAGPNLMEQVGGKVAAPLVVYHEKLALLEDLSKLMV